MWHLRRTLELSQENGLWIFFLVIVQCLYSHTKCHKMSHFWHFQWGKWKMDHGIFRLGPTLKIENICTHTSCRYHTWTSKSNATPPYFPLWCFDLGANPCFVTISRCGVISKMWIETCPRIIVEHTSTANAPLSLAKKCRNMQFLFTVFFSTNSFNQWDVKDVY